MLWAKFALVRAAWRLRLVPAGSLVRPQESPGVEVEATAGELHVATRWATAVRRASRYAVARPNCFARSLALEWLLRRWGIRSSHVHFGVRSGEPGFEAHAWVTVAGAVVGDDPGFVSRFREISDLSMVERA